MVTSPHNSLRDDLYFYEFPGATIPYFVQAHYEALAEADREKIRNQDRGTRDPTNSRDIVLAMDDLRQRRYRSLAQAQSNSPGSSLQIIRSGQGFLLPALAAGKCILFPGRPLSRDGHLSAKDRSARRVCISKSRLHPTVHHQY